MGLDNVAVQWPRTGRWYEPVSATEFADFADLADQLHAAPPHAPVGAAAALAGHIAKTGSVRVTAYTDLVDLVLGLSGVLYATDAAAEDEDPVIDPDQCEWIAEALEKFIARHREYSDVVTFDTLGRVLHDALATGRLAEQKRRWLDGRLAALRGPTGEGPQWSFPLPELAVLGAFYRRCAEATFAVYADY